MQNLHGHWKDRKFDHAKIEFLDKTSKLRKCTIARLGITIGEYFVNLVNALLKNEFLFGSIGHDNVVL